MNLLIFPNIGAFSGHLKGDDRISNLLEKTFFYIVPMFNVDGVQSAVPGDCTGNKYQGPRFDNKLTEEKVRVGLFNI